MESLVLIVIALVIWFAIIKPIRDRKRDERRLREHMRSALVVSDVSTRVTSAPARREPPKRRAADGRWHGPGERVDVAGITIADGMVYVGRFLPAYPSAATWQSEPDPSLINPELEVARSDADTAGATMTYWPSYSDIQPSARRAYLQWLASGKSDPQAYIGYVFLYFYGLERRLLIDRPSREEAGKLVAEIERLRRVYAANRSFDGYSRGLLDAVAALGLAGPVQTPEQATPDLLAGHPKLSLPLKIRIGRMIKEGQPLPFEFALAGYMSASRLPMPADRARSEFVALMRQRFERKYPEGFKLRPRHGPLQAWYRAANRHLSVDLLAGQNIGNIPDPDLMSWERLDKIVEEVCDTLGPYARLIGRRPEKRGSLEAKALLPVEIRQMSMGETGAAVRAWLEKEAEPLATVPIAELAKRVLGATEVKVGTKTLRSLAEVLEQFGYGLEPDPRYTSLRADGDDIAIVFKGPDATVLAQEPRETYKLACAIVTLVAGIANASRDGLSAQEVRWLDWIDKRLALSSTEAVRLRAHLYWLVAKKLSFAQVKRMLSVVPEAERRTIARFAATIAAADGVIEKTEVAFLEKIYDELEVERALLYAALHEAAAQTSRASAEPVTVIREGARPGYRIPAPPKEKPKRRLAEEQKGPELDPERLARIMAETQRVSSMLAGVFVETDAAPASASAPTASEDAPFDGIDRAHGILLARLLERATWSRSDFESLAREQGLMPDGALETINEWSFEVADEAVIEDGSELTVNQDLGRELAA